jgi:ClpP class serine protease
MLVNGVVNLVHAFSVFVSEGSKVLKRLEEVAGFSVVPILFGVNRYVNARAVDSIYTVLKELGAVDRLGIVLFCSGGDIDEAYLLATYLQRLAREKLVIYVPRFAKSAGTLLALAGDELVMLPIAELGPIDPVIYDSKTEHYIPLQSILEILNILSSGVSRDVVNAILEKLPVIELGDYKRAVEHNAELCARVLTGRMLRGDHEKARQIAEKLVSYKQHSAAIATRDAADLGLRVREASGEEAELLWSLHRLWVEHIIEYEALQPQEIVEPIEFRFGKGIVLTVAPREVINEARRVSSSPQGQQK